jgi:hypothetical protein
MIMTTTAEEVLMAPDIAAGSGRSMSGRSPYLAWAFKIAGGGGDTTIADTVLWKATAALKTRSSADPRSTQSPSNGETASARRFSRASACRHGATLSIRITLRTR